MSEMQSVRLRLGTRGSLLARAQSQQIADELHRRHPHVQVELITIRTTGDAIQDRPLAELGGKGLFVKELEQALLADQIDFAVHSYKDMPVTMPVVDESGLVIAAVPPRAAANDVAVVRDGSQPLWPDRARVGTGSLRRRCQILAAHPDAIIEPLRGNIDTRLRKLREGQFDLIVLAEAGLQRAGLQHAATLRPIDLLPAAGQGALALQCRRGDLETRQLLATLDHPPTAACVDAERALVGRLRGDCRSPIAAWATIDPPASGAGAPLPLRFRAAVGAAGGSLPVLLASARGSHLDVRAGLLELVDRVYADLSERGALALLHGAGDSLG
jgi:hydroxymethylbilane synthase